MTNSAMMRVIFGDAAAIFGTTNSSTVQDLGCALLFTSDVNPVTALKFSLHIRRIA